MYTDPTALSLGSYKSNDAFDIYARTEYPFESKNAQQEIAKYKLYSTEKSISEIAFLTGFSEQSAFTRAFKKWTSKTPMEFRKDT